MTMPEVKLVWDVLAAALASEATAKTFFSSSSVVHTQVVMTHPWYGRVRRYERT